MKKLHSDNKGITLAELIVTFALMGIFLAAAAAVISSSVMMHGELTGTMYATTVSETLLDKVTGELAAAQPKGTQSIVIGTVLKDGKDCGNGVSFYDRNGVHSCFYVEDRKLVMEGEETFSFDDNAYMGYRITDFAVERLNEENVLKVSLTLTNIKTGVSFATSKTTACYCFETQEDYDRIVEGDIPLNTF